MNDFVFAGIEPKPSHWAPLALTPALSVKPQSGEMK